MTIIIKNVCLLLEALSVVMCLHHLYGEKFRLDIATVSFLAIDMIFMQMVDWLGLPKMVSILIYLIMAIYCGVKFGFKVKPILINVILGVTITGVIEVIVMLVLYYLFGVQEYISYRLLFVNCIVFITVFIALSKLKLNMVSKFLQDKEKILAMTTLTCLIVILCIIISYKKIELMDLYNTFVLFICLLFILVLSGKLVKYKVKAAEIETELKMHELYSDSFQGLIDNIRLRQHEFDNHINTIYSQHFSYHTYEELVESQKNYCELITKENRFNKLLSRDNPVIRGFLYGRFIEIDKLGIEVSYHVAIKELDIGVPIYKLIEILGDLMNNAVEALLGDSDRNKLHIAIEEKDKFCLEVRNESPYIEYDMLGKFFSKGYSKKGESRGLGLYNVKQICEEYGLEVALECIDIDGENWLSFKVWKENGKKHL